ncbi:hypothetical protein [Gelidibacter salicanalis]|uniref:Uncharacterized protein n=1 Tax=Gelidibacter salicanalis TaxID=291193 RepID=A0A934KXL5_9FLAO|nr:hypothetical protein [Gelidibacter salicanalis]MBJ7881170.1 hypothetical protein [Gelidibacter salicanalis]
MTKEIKQSTPKSNTDLPAQETRRLSFDVLGLFETERAAAKTMFPQDFKMRIFISKLT